jgi:methionine-gamma-lyase
MDNEIDSAASGNRRRPKPDVVSIGNRRLRPATLMMGHGFDQSLSEGALKPPMFLTSAFVFESAASGKRHLVRISISVEDADDLIADSEQVLEAI